MTNASDERGIVSIHAGHSEGITINDPCWFFRRDGLIGHGEVFLVSDVGSAVRLKSHIAMPSADDSAVLVTKPQLTTLRKQMPQGTTIRGKLVRLPPGRRTGWIDIGKTAGLQLEDSLLVLRAAKDKRIPIARGQVVLLEDQTALLAFQPLVGNALPDPNDDVELWPAPAEGVGKALSSTVIAVEEGSDSPVIRIVGTAHDGLTAGRMVDLFRDHRFIGVANLTNVSEPLSMAEVIVSASPDKPLVGDIAVIREPRGDEPQPIRAVVFNIQSDVCLLATGEADGVTVGEKFVVQRVIDSKPIDVAELTIYTVQVDYAGARIRLITPENYPVQQWDFAERSALRSPTWHEVGTIRQVASDARTAFVASETPSTITAGMVLRIQSPADPRLAVAGIVLHATERGAEVYLPTGWADLGQLTNASVQALKDTK